MLRDTTPPQKKLRETKEKIRRKKFHHGSDSVVQSVTLQTPLSIHFHRKESSAGLCYIIITGPSPRFIVDILLLLSVMEIL